jgi:hypothetical protein
MLGERVFVRSDTDYKLFPAAEMSVDAIPRWLDTYVEHRGKLVSGVVRVIPLVREHHGFVDRGEAT